MSDVPLIWTSHGNMLVSLLDYRTEWDFQPTYIKLTESYFLGDELVRQSAHVYDKQGITASGQAAQI